MFPGVYLKNIGSKFLLQRSSDVLKLDVILHNFYHKINA